MKLTAQADRVAFILHVIDTMNCATQAPFTVSDLENIVEYEVQRKRRYAPCHAEFRDHISTIAAAHYLAHHRRDLWENSKAAMRMDAHAVMENLRNRVKNWCNRDDVPGYFWI